MNAKKYMVIFLHAFIGWLLCDAVIGIGRNVTYIEITLIIHAIAVPIIFGIISSVYNRKFNYTTPLNTAIIFTSFVIFMDFFVVAILIEKSFEMFSSILGTWIPFILIFLSTYIAGLSIRREIHNK